MVRMDRFISSPLSAQAVPDETHCTISVYGCQDQPRIGVHESFDTVQEEPGIIQVFDHFTCDDDIKGLI